MWQRSKIWELSYVLFRPLLRNVCHQGYARHAGYAGHAEADLLLPMIDVLPEVRMRYKNSHPSWPFNTPKMRPSFVLRFQHIGWKVQCYPKQPEIKKKIVEQLKAHYRKHKKVYQNLNVRSAIIRCAYIHLVLTLAVRFM
jgi:hypothetical protein